jgi:hypothetical protein
MDGATQARLAKNMRAARSRQLSRASVHADGDYPKWAPDWTTARYVQIFGLRCAAPLDIDFNRLGDRLAPYLTPEQDLVIVETESDCELA